LFRGLSFKHYLLPLLYRSLGGLFQKHGNASLALACYREAACLNPADAEPVFLSGRLLLLQGQVEPAAAAFREALQARPDYAEAHNALGVALYEQGRLGEAVDCYRSALRWQPAYAHAYNNLGNVQLSQGQIAEAEASFRQALHLDPDYADAHNNLGRALNEQGRQQEAEQSLREALRLKPDFAGALSNLGSVLLSQRKPEEAVNAYREALHLQPDLGEAHANLAMLFNESSQLARALAYYEKQMRRNPHSPQAHNRLGTALQAQGRFEEANRQFEAALEARPDFAEAHGNLGMSFIFLGDLEKALENFRKALSLKPISEVQASYAFYLNCSPDHTPTEIAAEYRLWASRYISPSKAMPSFGNSVESGRKLKLGYVSPDFMRHSVAYFIEPVIRNHDRSQVEVYCYSNVATPDDYTERLKGIADHWRDIRLKSDDQVCEMIRSDGIDILIDLAGHTSGNRLPVFARKPAPVQVTYLGHPNTSGLEAIDYRITDALVDPPGLTECYHCEQLIRLPRCFITYAPPADAPEVAISPVSRKGHITFGSFNSAVKINHRVIALWAKLLLAVPKSRMLLKSLAFCSASAKSRLIAMFARHGIEAERIELLDFVDAVSGHLDLYREIDIALDTFPYNGTTTTCEALWMGVPVIVLAGETHVSRVGLSLLVQVGLTELIAKDADGYLALALELANDTERLRQLRSSLRDRLRLSPLADALGFTRELENAYRGMWHRWCAQSSPSPAGNAQLEVMTSSILLEQENATAHAQTVAPSISLKEIADAARNYLANSTPDKLETLRKLRRTLVNFIMHQQPDLATLWPNTLCPMYKALKTSGVRDMGRTASDLELIDTLRPILAAGWSHPACPFATVAAMFYVYSYEVPLPKSLRGAPGWLLPDLGSFLLEMPPIFAREGEAELYVTRLEQAVALFHGEIGVKSDNVKQQIVEIFVSNANFLQSYFSERNLRELFRMRGDIVAAAMATNSLYAFPPRIEARKRLRVGIYAQQFSAHTETFFTLAALDCLDRERFELRLYATQGTNHPLEALAASKCDRFTVLPPGDLSAQVKGIRADDLDILFIGTNMSAVSNGAMLLGAHRLARIQIASESSPVTTGLHPMDVLLTAKWNAPWKDAPDHYTEHLYRMPGSNNVYAYQYDRDPASIKRSRLEMNISDGQLVFFSGANYFKIVPELSAAWARILAKVPDSVLILMPFNPNWSDNYLAQPFLSRVTTQLAQVGVDPARLRLVTPVPNRADVHLVIALADIYLDSYPFSGACSLLDPIQVGVPPVVRQGRTGRAGHGASLLRQLDMSELVTDSAEAYIALAIRLASDAMWRNHLAARLKSIAVRETPPYLDTRSLSKRVGRAFSDLYAAYQTHYQNLARMEPDALAAKTAELVPAGVKLEPSLAGFNDTAMIERLVVPFFRARADTTRSLCMLDVGACFGQMAIPFLSQGWEVHLFEPDPESCAVLERNVSPFGDKARVVATAVSNGDARTISFHKSRTRGLSGLSASPYGATAEIIEVPCMRLADYCAQQGLSTIDFLKIDAEGHDFEVLRSLDFGRVAPRIIMVEFGTSFHGQGVGELERLIAEMKQNGYRSVIFGYDDDSNIRNGIWTYELSCVTLDAPCPAAAAQLFGNVIFFQAGDKDFMLSLYALFDAARPRRAFLADAAARRRTWNGLSHGLFRGLRRLAGLDLNR
jgi:FkbM family methyltransferase